MSHSVPVLAIAFLAIAHLIISGEDQLPEYVNSTTFSISAMIWYIFLFCILILFFDLDFDGRKKSSKYPRFRLWTFPVLINGPFGVVSATEFIGIVVFVAYVIWAFSAYAMQALADMSDQLSFRAQRYYCSLLPFLYFVKPLIICDLRQFWPRSTVLQSPITVTVRWRPFSHEYTGLLKYHKRKL